MEREVGVNVRRGAWTKEEDALLKKCIQYYGEGKWHLVPPRAGLNRCRKSCRLRWLNYLKPDIKRGNFDEDEVDLLRRMYKLLGNRWSLIADRLPGRTANDVKNFWNANNREKQPKQPKMVSTTTTSTTTSSNIIKPKTRKLTLSRSSILLDSLNYSNGKKKTKASMSSSSSSQPFKLQEMSNNSSPSPLVKVDDNDKLTRWWQDLLQMTENGLAKLPISSSEQEMANHGSPPPLVKVEDDEELTRWWNDLPQMLGNGEDGLANLPVSSQQEMANHGSPSPLVQVEDDEEHMLCWNDLPQLPENGEDNHFPITSIGNDDQTIKNDD